jgi:hypothetical protein
VKGQWCTEQQEKNLWDTVCGVPEGIAVPFSVTGRRPSISLLLDRTVLGQSMKVKVQDFLHNGAIPASRCKRSWTWGISVPVLSSQEKKSRKINKKPLTTRAKSAGADDKTS